MTEQSANPLLHRIQIPGETFRLPSHGLFYKNGELDDSVIDGEVHVHPMTAIDEVMMRTPDALFSGRGIDEVFRKCIPEILKPMDLLAKDVDYLLTCLRLITYGPTMDIEYTHTCPDAKNHTYSIPLKPIIIQSKPIDPTTLAQHYRVVLDNQQVVLMQPPKLSGIIKLYQSFDTSDTDLTPSAIKRNVIDAIASMVFSVDDVTDPAMIEEWLASIPAGYMRKITDAIDASGEWGPNFFVDQVCQDCGESIKIEISTNPISFFS